MWPAGPDFFSTTLENFHPEECLDCREYIIFGLERQLSHFEKYMTVCNYPLVQLVNRPNIEENLRKTQIIRFLVPRGCCFSVNPCFP